MPLTDTAVKNAKTRAKPYKLSDAGGLYLFVSPTGALAWRYKYRIGGKEGTFAIGQYPDVSLKEARECHAKARELVKAGIPPLSHRRAEKLKVTSDSANTFKAISEDWISKTRDRWSAYYLKQVERFMETDIHPKIGSLPIKQVTAAHVLKIMKDAEARGAETVALFMRQLCSQVFRYAVSNLQADVDPTYALKGAVVRPKVQHNKPLSAKQIPDFKVALRKYGGYRITCIAIELLMLTFVRTVELRKAEWTEFDLDAAIWRIPAERMKMKTEHIVPLSEQAVVLLRELHEISGGGNYLFPNNRRTKECMTITTINRALERMGYAGKFSAHGFRGTASTLLHEMNYRSEIIERQLAHAEGNKVKAAYNKAEYLTERKLMMQQWADYIGSLNDATNVIPFGKSA